jgi:gamma-glutamylcyclotransferase (GGCT)/AIG2-like uncharacterized protein YtfP
MSNPKLASFMETKASENSFTPDLGHLTRHYDAVPVFVYGTQMKRLSEAYQMAGATFISTGRTTRNTHVMYIHDSNGWKEPIVFHMPLLKDTGSVVGELYLMPVKSLPYLDNLMSNGLWVKRSYEHIRYKEYHQTGKIQECVTEAFIYLGDVEYWKKEQENGKLARKDRWIGSFGPYYTFQYTDDESNRNIVKKAVEFNKQQQDEAKPERRLM